MVAERAGAAGGEVAAHLGPLVVARDALGLEGRGGALDRLLGVLLDVGLVLVGQVWPDDLMTSSDPRLAVT